MYKPSEPKQAFYQHIFVYLFCFEQCKGFVCLLLLFTALIPQMTVVFPIFTRADPSQVDIDPEQKITKQKNSLGKSKCSNTNHRTLTQPILDLTYVQG